MLPRSFLIKRTRSDEKFNMFCDKTVADADKHNIGHPELPRYRRRPTWFNNSSDPYVFRSAKAYFRHIYFEACDLYTPWRIRRKIQLKKNSLNGANGSDFEDKELKTSCYKYDVDMPPLTRHLQLLQDVVKQVSLVKDVTPFKLSVM